ncbi:hypothetical protein [Nostoc sp.]
MSVRYLRSAGYDVAYGSEDAPVAEDSELNYELRITNYELFNILASG